MSPTTVASPPLPFQDRLKPIVLMGNYNAAELWPTINLCLLGWGLLLLFPRWKHTAFLTLLPPLFHAYMYSSTLISFVFLTERNNNTTTNNNNEDVAMDMATFEGVVRLFQDPNGVFVGWVHYVVFDLLVGRMIVQDSIDSLQVSHWIHYTIIAPCLFLTLMFGPFGWLLYMMVRHTMLILRRRSSTANTTTTTSTTTGGTTTPINKVKVF